MLDRRTHARQLRAATPPSVRVAEPHALSKNEQVRAVKARVAKLVEFQDRITTADVRRHILEETGLDFGGPTLAKYLKALGFVRMRQGIYQRSAS